MLDTISHEFQNLREVAGRVIVANILGVLTALSREAYGPAFAGIFGAYLIALLIQRRQIPWREGVLVALACIGAGLYGVYMIVAYRVIPGFSAWYQQNPFASPDLFDFLIGFAPLIMLAAAGLFLYFKRPPPDRSISPSRHLSFLIAWLIVGPLMAYLPLVISRRLIAGWQIPLCIFAAYALLRLIDSKVPLRRAIAIGALALSAISTLIIIGMGVVFVSAPRPPLYQSADELAALEWLGAQTTDRDVVLSEWRFGNLLPIYADARVFVGHPIETIGYKEKRATVDRFFDPATSEADRQAVIDRWQITFVVAPTDRPAPPRSQIVFQQGQLNIYQMTP
jgi:hypothetical protein